MRITLEADFSPGDLDYVSVHARFELLYNMSTVSCKCAETTVLTRLVKVVNIPDARSNVEIVCSYHLNILLFTYSFRHRIRVNQASLAYISKQ